MSKPTANRLLVKKYTFGKDDIGYCYKVMDFAMNRKSQRINDIVKYLQTKYGVSNILLRDHWEADENAIGLTDKSEQFLAYISTVESYLQSI